MNRIKRGELFNSGSFRELLYALQAIIASSRRSSSIFAHTSGGPWRSLTFMQFETSNSAEAPRGPYEFGGNPIGGRDGLAYLGTWDVIRDHSNLA